MPPFISGSFEDEAYPVEQSIYTIWNNSIGTNKEKTIGIKVCNGSATILDATDIDQELMGWTGRVCENRAIYVCTVFF